MGLEVADAHSLFTVVRGVPNGFLEYALDSSMATSLARRVVRVGTLHLLLAACVTGSWYTVEWPMGFLRFV